MMPRRMDRNTTMTSIMVVASLLLIPAGFAHAQCPDPDSEVLTFPNDGATKVPRNVVLRAEFPSTRDPRGEPYWLVLDDRGGRVEGESGWDGGTSTFTPSSELDARRTYTARVTAQATGDWWQFSFLTGTGADLETPSFGGLSGLSVRMESEDWLLSNCRLARGDGFLFTLEVPRPSDDGADDELCYYVYQTAGPGAESEHPVAWYRPDGDDEITLVRSVEDGEGEFCFRVEVRDLAGRLDGNSRERCVEVVAGAIFADACSVTGPSAGPEGARASLALLLLAGLVLSRRLRRP